jgi:hypothetical protein
MPANTDPIFSKNARVASVLVTAANTSSQGGGTIGTDIFLVLQAGSTDGSFIRFVRAIPTATAATTTTATVLRIFASSVTSGATTSANTYLIAEYTLPAIAADNASTAVIFFDIPLNFAIPASWTILATNHAAPAANTAWRIIGIGGDY